MTEQSDTLVRDRPWEPRRTFSTPLGERLVSDCIQLANAHEQAAGLQQRGMRRERRVVLEAVVADVLHRHLTEPDAWVAITRDWRRLGAQGPYRAPAESRKLPGMLDLLCGIGLIEMRGGYSARYDHPAPGEHGSRQTTIRAAPRLTEMADGLGLTQSDLRRTAGGGDPIVLRAAKAHWETEGQSLPFTDTDEIVTMRREMDRINRHLAQADIKVAEGATVDPDGRYLRRIFSRGQFGCGGRLYGGFWINMAPDVRHEAIRIGGEEVTTLDYSALGVRITYGLAGLSCPIDRDPYIIPGQPGWRRDGLKIVLSTMLADDGPGRERWPRVENGKPKVRSYFPKGTKVQAVITALEQQHQPIREQMYRDLAPRLQRHDSDLMVKILLRLIGMDVVALPIHDALVVPKSAEAISMWVMEEEFRSTFGGPCLVASKQ